MQSIENYPCVSNIYDPYKQLPHHRLEKWLDERNKEDICLEFFRIAKESGYLREDNFFRREFGFNDMGTCYIFLAPEPPEPFPVSWYLSPQGEASFTMYIKKDNGICYRQSFVFSLPDYKIYNYIPHSVFRPMGSAFGSWCSYSQLLGDFSELLSRKSVVVSREEIECDTSITYRFDLDPTFETSRRRNPPIDIGWGDHL